MQVKKSDSYYIADVEGERKEENKNRSENKSTVFYFIMSHYHSLTENAAD